MAICRHSSLVRRTLGDVDPVLQENKAENLRLALPHVSGILIRPGETFSFWKLVGNCTARLRGEGRAFCKGCPPVPSQIARTIDAGVTLDD